MCAYVYIYIHLWIFNNYSTRETSTNRERERELSLFTKCLIRVSFFDVTRKVTQNGRASHRIPFLNDHHRSEWEEGKNGSILQVLTVYVCFLGEWNPVMTSKSKLDPFSWIVVHGPKRKTPNFLAFKGYKIWRKNPGPKNFSPEKHGSSESLFMRKRFLGLI